MNRRKYVPPSVHQSDPKVYKQSAKHTLKFHDVFYSQYSHPHVSAGIPAIFRALLLLQDYKCGYLCHHHFIIIIII